MTNAARSAAPDASEIQDRVYQALARALLYDALAMGFEPRRGGNPEYQLSADGLACIRGAAERLATRPSDDGSCFETNGGLTAAAERLARAASAHEPERMLHDLCAESDRLLGHSAHGTAPPYETEYGAGDVFQQPHELADLGGFLRAFGLQLHPEVHERVDHVSVQCEFLGFLATKEAYALAHGDGEMLEHTRKAQRLLLRDHLGRFAPAFARRLVLAEALGSASSSGAADVSGPPTIHGALAGMLLAVLRHHCAELDVELGSPKLELRPWRADEMTMACGNGDCRAGTDCDAPSRDIPAAPAAESPSPRSGRAVGGAGP